VFGAKLRTTFEIIVGQVIEQQIVHGALLAGEIGRGCRTPWSSIEADPGSRVEAAKSGGVAACPA
jgi:hypothetical protein